MHLNISLLYGPVVLHYKIFINTISFFLLLSITTKKKYFFVDFWLLFQSYKTEKLRFGFNKISLISFPKDISIYLSEGMIDRIMKNFSLNKRLFLRLFVTNIFKDLGIAYTLKG